MKLNLPWYGWLAVVVAAVVAVAALVWGITKALSGNKEEPSASPGIAFARFDRPASEDISWCVATRYRITYVTNGLESEPRPHLDVAPSLTHADPVLTLHRPANIHEVKWYRAEATDDFKVWREHTMERVPDKEEYIDRFNVCEQDVPPKPEPFGTFGSMWNAEAGSGGVPWCVPTRYRARYRRGDQVSPWSEESVEFRSDVYTNPGVRVEPREGFTVEWIASSTITLPAGNSYSGRTTDPDAQNFSFSHPAGATDESWNIWLDLGDWWVPGSKSLTMPLEDFVAVWNHSADVDPDVSKTVGHLSITKDGRLELEPFVSKQSATIKIDDEDWPGWWQAMGFSQIEPTNEPIVASRWPVSDVLFIGEQFVDTKTWCTTPNAPLFVGFSGRAGPDKQFAWCKPTKYKYAYVVNGVELTRSPESVEVYDETQTDPVFQVQQSEGTIKWYRLENDGRVLREHTEHMIMIKMDSPVAGTARYVDMANPCRTPFVPSAPTRPQPNGAVGNQMWNRAAGGGVAPWCQATTYVARYASDTHTTDWSLPSVVFQSTRFTEPTLTVEAEPGYTVEWGRQSPNVIELPCFMIGSNCNQLDQILGNGPQGQIFWRINFAQFFDDYSTPPDISLSLSTFVEWWNTPSTGGPNLGRLELLPSGKLALRPTAWQGPGTYHIVEQKWWAAMGFPLTFQWAPVLEATRVPNGSNGNDTIELIGTGETVTDVDNPCQ